MKYNGEDVLRDRARVEGCVTVAEPVELFLARLAYIERLELRAKTAERIAKRRFRLVKMARKAILSWANSDDGGGPDFLLAQALESCNQELRRTKKEDEASG